MERCVESVLNQTYTNLEIILIDDGSPDECGRICDDYQQKDNRIKVIHQKNGGLSNARNTGIRAATGDYITFIDSDDSVKSNMVATLLQLILDHNAEIVASSESMKMKTDRIHVGTGTDILLEIMYYHSAW